MEIAKSPNSKVVIVGGGTMGSSAAYWLSREPFDGEITVVERDPTYARASSALSTSETWTPMIP